MNTTEEEAFPVLCDSCFALEHTGACQEPPIPIPAFEDDPVAMALGLTPPKPGVVLPGSREHCPSCAAEWRLVDFLIRAMALTEQDPPDPSVSFARVTVPPPSGTMPASVSPPGRDGDGIDTPPTSPTTP